jgi:hypothetical protein
VLSPLQRERSRESISSPELTHWIPSGKMMTPPIVAYIASAFEQWFLQTKMMLLLKFLLDFSQLTSTSQAEMDTCPNKVLKNMARIFSVLQYLYNLHLLVLKLWEKIKTGDVPEFQR